MYTKELCMLSTPPKTKIDAVKVASGVALPSNYIFSTDSDLQGLNSSSTKSHITPNSMPSSLTEL